MARRTRPQRQPTKQLTPTIRTRIKSARASLSPYPGTARANLARPASLRPGANESVTAMWLGGHGEAPGVEVAVYRLGPWYHRGQVARQALLAVAGQQEGKEH